MHATKILTGFERGLLACLLIGSVVCVIGYAVQLFRERRRSERALSSAADLESEEDTDQQSIIYVPAVHRPAAPPLYSEVGDLGIGFGTRDGLPMYELAEVRSPAYPVDVVPVDGAFEEVDLGVLQINN